MPLDRYPLPGVEGRTDRLAQDDVRNDPQPGLSAVIMTAVTPYALAASCVGALAEVAQNGAGEQSGTSFAD